VATERYEALNVKYVVDGQRLLDEGDYVQAGEKYWGAVATMIKAVATQRHWRHASHRDLGRVVKNLVGEVQDEEYAVLFRSAERLHENFYEDGFDPDQVRRYSNDASVLVQKLSARLGGNPQ
jgi:hypothetical protein